jgi:tetratricopeptide (TPR) repeat protein
MAKKKKKQRRKTNSLAPPKKVSSETFTHFFTGMRTALLLSGLVVLVFVIYSNSLNGPFIFDDMSNIEHNSHIRLTRLTFDGLKQAALESSASHRPVANISFALNYFFHGPNTFGYHLVNILIHAIAGIFLYFFIKTTLSIPVLRSKFENQKWIAFITALIWLVHPVQTQSVTYIVQRMNSLAAMFYVMALFFYARGRISQIAKNRWLWFSGCAVAGLLASGSKQTAATLPLFIFIYEWYFFQDLSRAWFKRRILPLAGVLILFGALALIYLGVDPLETILSGYDKRDFTPLQRLLTQFRVVIFYISLLIFPHPSRLNLDRDVTLSHSIIDPFTTLVCMAAIAGLLLLAWRLAPKQRLVSFCILWFLGNLVIESSVIGLEIIFDHRTYLPSMLVCLPAVVLLYPRLRPKWLGIGVLAAVVLVFSSWTYERNRVFRDQITIWGDCAAKSPNKARPHNNLGIFLKKKGRLEEARALFQKALQLKPEYASAHINLGATLASLGKLEEAIGHFTRVLKIRPNDAEAHFNMGNAKASQRKYEEAARYFSETLRIKPKDREARQNLKKVQQLMRPNQALGSDLRSSK